MRHFSSILLLVVASCLLSLSPALAQGEPTMGLNLLDESQYRSIPLASTPLLGDVPDEADLTEYFPRPGNQGRQSSCVGWAVANLKAYQEKVERKWSFDQAGHRFSPAYIYNQIKTSTSCNGGSNFSEALNLLRRSGAATLQDFPYDENACSRLPDQSVNQRAREFAIADWRRVNPQDETEVRIQIASGFPVLIGMMVDTAFGQLRGEKIYHGPVGPPRGAHAMVVVGYSESRKAFKLINSWGPEWGQDGFGWIDYASFRSLVREAYVAQDIVVNTPPGPGPSPSPSPTPPPSPMPRPSPVADAEVTMGVPVVAPNVPITTNTGIYPGMQITVPGAIRNAAGRSMQIVVKFNYLNGPPLRANPSEPIYHDTGGLVATGTPPVPVATNLESMDRLQISIPYYALNFAPTGGQALLNLSLTAVAFVDNQQKAQSALVPFQLRW